MEEKEVKGEVPETKADLVSKEVRERLLREPDLGHLLLIWNNLSADPNKGIPNMSSQFLDDYVIIRIFFLLFKVWDINPFVLAEIANELERIHQMKKFGRIRWGFRIKEFFRRVIRTILGGNHEEDESSV